MRDMTSLQVLSSIQELPEPSLYSTIATTTVARKTSEKTYFPKKKLVRLHGVDPRIYTNLLLPLSVCAEKREKKLEANQVKKGDFVIPKIVVEEIVLPNEQPRNEMNIRAEACKGLLHPSHAVYSAISANDPYSLKNIILSGRVNVNQLNASGVTALHEASYEGKSHCVNILVQCGADVDCKDREGWTPLHAAVCGGNHKCAAYLLRHGASIRAKNDDGLTPIAIAVQQRDKNMVQLLSTLSSNFSNSNRAAKRPLLKSHV